MNLFVKDSTVNNRAQGYIHYNSFLSVSLYVQFASLSK